MRSTPTAALPAAAATPVPAEAKTGAVSAGTGRRTDPVRPRQEPPGAVRPGNAGSGTLTKVAACRAAEIRRTWWLSGD